MTDIEVYAGAVMAGAASGMRTFSGPALVSQVSHAGLIPTHASLGFVSHPAASQGSFVAALAELVLDKLPGTPSRLALGPLMSRAIAGGFSGATLTASRKRSVYLGAIAGSFAAIGAAYGGYHLRRLVVRTLHLPDPLVALAEDAAVIGCAALVIRNLHATKAGATY